MILKQNVNIVCVCVGDKYNKTHVNRLYKMVKRHCSLPFSFYCISDQQQDVNTIFIDQSLDLESYWWKMVLFNLDWDNITLYLDLDVVIQNNFDYVFVEANETPSYCFLLNSDDLGEYNPYDGTPDNILVIPSTVLNTSVMLFNPTMMKDVYTKFINDVDYNIITYYGVDRFLYHNYNKFRYLQFGKDWYHRAKGVRLPHHEDQYNLIHDPDCTFCILSQCPDKYYQGLEKYFL